MADILDRVFVGESIANGVIRLRIAGMGLAELAGTDMKGMPLTAIFLPEARSRLTEALELVVTSHAVVEMHLQAEQSIGRPALDGRLLLLPLRPAKEGTTLVLGCLATEGKIGRAPRRFGITHLVTERTTPHLPQEQMTAPMAFAEPWVPPLAGKGLPARPLPARPHLRLVHSAD
jgi:hypothetical protein